MQCKTQVADLAKAGDVTDLCYLPLYSTTHYTRLFGRFTLHYEVAASCKWTIAPQKDDASAITKVHSLKLFLRA